MKTCVSSYSFSRYVRESGATQLQLISLAKEMGFDAIEFTDLCPPEGVDVLDYAKQLREEAEKLSMPIANYTIGADFLNAEDLDAEIERLYTRVDIAQALGALGMRHDATGGYKGPEKKYKTFDDALPILAKGCRAVTEYAAAKGITTMVENHGFFCQDSTRVEKLVHAVGHENFGLLVDIGNFLCADDPSVTAVSRVANFARHVHIKDFHIKSGSEPDPGNGWFRTRGGNYLRGAIVGHGNVPVMQCLSILKRSEYDGFVSIEFEGIESNLDALSTGLENLKRYIEMA
ncbi:MAG: sugar phosphate isomerase/epimerase [Clostridia bacterium]|nr:sugar phosphate isomerase/epimerase [Clostridia bacterium]